MRPAPKDNLEAVVIDIGRNAVKKIIMRKITRELTSRHFASFSLVKGAKAQIAIITPIKEASIP